jgi:hypothetical protein
LASSFVVAPYNISNVSVAVAVIVRNQDSFAVSVSRI